VCNASRDEAIASIKRSNRNQKEKICVAAFFAERKMLVALRRTAAE